MPVLAAYINKSGFYVADYILPAGNVVWQIGEPGLRGTSRIMEYRRTVIVSAPTFAIRCASGS